jgi:site-specific recombinase XerD
MLKAFFRWLAGRPGFRSRFAYEDSEYFDPTDRDTQIALAQRHRPVPTLEQVSHALESMSAETVVERRDRALFALIMLTGCRDRAVVSLKLKDIDLDKSMVFQDAREVATKRGKTIATYFFPVGDAPLAIVRDWVAVAKGPVAGSRRCALPGNSDFDRGEWSLWRSGRRAEALE